ncbi:hypothetical protein [Pseudomonas sp. USHLN015]|uniref:hypothetical protein n=1 Tax=Pseudomonas sp. USHLN015 TaxID=3081296 RepID=UPI00301CCC8B
MRARIENGIVMETASYDPWPEFNPSLLWVECPDWVGQGCRYEDGEFRPVVVDEVAVRAQWLSKNNLAYESATTALTANYPQLEKDTWPTQDEESKAWVADPEGAPTPWIDLAASERGLAREEYLRRTLVKSRQFKVLSAFLTGRRQRYEDQIKAGATPALDYELTLEVLLQLQQIATDGMSRPVAELRTVL